MVIPLCMVIRQRPATLQFWDCSGTGSDSGVVLDSRVQTLRQSLGDCVVNVTVSGLAGTGTCDFTSTIQLILQTTSAHGYNFIFPNLGVGTYYLSIQAAADSGAVVNTGTGSAVGGAAYGLGSVTIESVIGWFTASPSSMVHARATDWNRGGSPGFPVRKPGLPLRPDQLGWKS